MLCQEDKYLIIKYLKIFIILKLSVFDTILFDNGQIKDAGRFLSEFGFVELRDFSDYTSNFNPRNLQIQRIQIQTGSLRQGRSD
jgi:hypothetical protein